MTRVRPGDARRASFGPGLSLLVAALGALAPAACERSSAARAVADAHDAPAAPVPVTPAPLPEDRAAGEKSHQQWLDHMQFEERERQLGYDKRKLKEHRALIGVLSAARKRYDAARTVPAVEKLQARTPALADDVHKRITAIDHWGVNSRLLDDYNKWLAALSDSYPAAVKAALGGDRRALADARAEQDLRLRTMQKWLKDAAESEEE